MVAVQETLLMRGIVDGKVFSCLLVPSMRLSKMSTRILFDHEDCFTKIEIYMVDPLNNLRSIMDRDSPTAILLWGLILLDAC